MLEPLNEAFPRLKLLWGDSHYGGTFLTWVKVNLGWLVQTVKALIVPKRGLLVSEGEEVEWDTLFPNGFRPLPEMLGGGAQFLLDRALASALSRS